MLKRMHFLPILAVAAMLAVPVVLLGHLPPVHELSFAPPSQAPGAPAVPSNLMLLPFAIGAIKVKAIGDVARKFVRNAQAAAGDYAEGVKGAGSDWEAGALAAEDNYGAGVQAAIADKRFGRGVREAGASKYVAKASTLGANRFGPGVAQAESDFVRGAGPVLETIRGLTLPPRRPKGDPGNQARSQAVAAALRAMKVGK